MLVFGAPTGGDVMPRCELNDEPIAPSAAYSYVKDELINEGNARQNLATFCQTYMSEEAVRLMSETLDKNAIDKSEYPQTVELENRCVNIIADLWNAPDDEGFLGTSTVGSSEACMLAGMAMKFRWRNRAKEAGIDILAHKPNIVISSGYQVCWEKFCVYWDIDLRAVPMSKDCMALDVDALGDYVDDYTIGIVGILGITYTGEYDNIAAMDKWVSDYNKTAKISVPIHVDAASGGMFAPFIQPDMPWDFRLKNVVSINTSGHKYGLVYPGIGWVIWRNAEYLPDELIFKVSYLGGEMPTMAINFSRSASQIIGQYYNFVRYGFKGYKAVHERTRDSASTIAHAVKATGLFDIVNDGTTALPIVCYKLKDDANVEWTLYDLSDRLRMSGWQVPTYPMPANIDNMIVHRIVVRADLEVETARAFVADLEKAIGELNDARVLQKPAPAKGAYGFTH
jgi:glutamate decarboxylase